MRLFLSSDMHLGHASIIRYCNRPWLKPGDLDSKGEWISKEIANLRCTNMTEDIIARFNTVVKPDDMVLHLGDFCFRNSSGGKVGEGSINKAYEYIKQLNGIWTFVAGNHDCLSKDTKILTAEGFKNYNEIIIGTIIPTVNIQKQCIEYHPIEDIQINYIDKAIEYTQRNKPGFIVSEDHNIFIEKFNQRPQTVESFKTIKAKEAFQYKSGLDIPSSWPSGNRDYTIEDNWLSLLGWILTDASYKVLKNGEFRITLYQSKPDKVKQIQQLLAALNIKYKQISRIDKPLCSGQFIGKKLVKGNYIAQQFHVSNDSSNLIGKKLQLTKSRYIFPAWLHKLSDRQVKVLCFSLLAGNGCGQVLWGRRTVLEQVQALCCTHGILTSIVDYSPNCDYLVFYQGRNKNISQTLGVTQKAIEYNDLMWDITVPNHLFFAERGGKVMITGNSRNSLKTHIYNLTVNYGNYKFFCVHSPDHANPEFSINLVGHVHNRWLIRPLGTKSIMYNVGVDLHNFYPISIETVLADINKWRRNGGQTEQKSK